MISLSHSTRQGPPGGQISLGLPPHGRSRCMIGAHIIASQVAMVFQVPAEVMICPQRGKARQALARQVMMYLLHVCCGQSYTEVGRMIGRDRSTVAHACRLIEDRRENDQIDQALDIMERSIFWLQHIGQLEGLPNDW